MKHQLILEIKKNIFYRAKIFIEEIGSFVPFGTIILNGIVRDVMIEKDFEDSIPGLEFVNIMKEDFENQIQNNLAQAGAIAYDIIIDLKNSDGVVEKRDALCLIITDDGKNWAQDYFPYMIIDGQCVWR
jgi:hypothetical protein